MSNSRRSRDGFTLVEMIVVISIIGVLASVIVVRYSGQTDQAKVAAAKSQISQIESAVISFQAQVGRLPRSLSELTSRPPNAPSWKEGGYIKGTGAPKDPWGNEYRYRRSRGGIEIISLGADGKDGGRGVDADLSSNNLDARK